MNRSIFQIWQFTIKKFKFNIKINFFFIIFNLLFIFLMWFFGFFKINAVFCDDFTPFFRKIILNNGEYLCSKGVTMPNLINSRLNFINFWTPPHHFQFLKFKRNDGLNFYRPHSMFHPNISIFYDYCSNVHWLLQLTSHLRSDLEHLFTFLSNQNLYGETTPQYISNHFRIVSGDEMLIESSNNIYNKEISDKILIHFNKIVVKNNITPIWISEIQKNI